MGYGRRSLIGITIVAVLVLLLSYLKTENHAIKKTPVSYQIRSELDRNIMKVAQFNAGKLISDNIQGNSAWNNQQPGVQNVVNNGVNDRAQVIQPEVNSNNVKPVVNNNVQPVANNFPADQFNAQLGFNNAQSGLNNVQPGVNNVQPGVNNVQPGVNYNVQPGVNNIQPGVNYNVQPGVNNVQPGINNVQPGVNNIQPGVNNVQPGVNNIQPIDNLQPEVNVNQNQPGVNSVQNQPGVNVAQNQPGVNIAQNQPGVNVNQNQPGVNVAQNQPVVNAAQQNVVNFQQNGVTLHPDVRVAPSYPSINVTHPLSDCIDLPTSPKAGVKICLHPTAQDIWVSGSLRKGVLWEANLVHTMAEILKLDHRMQLLDLGSNIGEFTLFAAAMGRRVLAVDMLPKNVLALQTALKLSELSSYVTIVQNALFRDRRTMGIVEEGNNVGGTALNFGSNLNPGSDPKSVRTVLLDDLLPLVLQDAPAFMKIDIENSEHHALAGGLNFLSKVDVQFVQMEWRQKKPDAGNEILNILEGLGFVCSKSALTYTPLNLRNMPQAGDVYFVKKKFYQDRVTTTVTATSESRRFISYCCLNGRLYGRTNLLTYIRHHQCVLEIFEVFSVEY